MLVIAAVALAQSLAAKGSEKTPLPMAVATARFIAAVPLAADGRANFLDPMVAPEDRVADSAVEEELRRWGHYIVTLRASEADVVLGIRAGRIASATGGVRIGGDTAPGTSPRVGSITGVEVGPADDTLAVFLNGPESAPVWIHSQHNGFEGKLPLVKRFEDDVEKTAAAKKP
jgi:hypothetical protein